MSAATSPDPSQTASSTAKKKSSKKKKNAKSRVTEEVSKESEAGDIDLENADAADPDAEESQPSAVNTPKDAQFPDISTSQANGHIHDSHSNGHAIKSSNQSSANGAEQDNVTNSNLANGSDASSRLEAMSQEREALRAEVEQLRKSLEGLQGKHAEEVAAIKEQHVEQLSSVQAKHEEEVSTIKSQHAEEVTNIRSELEESESAKEKVETQHQTLLGRMSTIRTTFGERFKADKQELEEKTEQIEELQSQNENLQQRVEGLEDDVRRLEQESHESSKELSSLRNRHNLSQQNWVNEREDLTLQTKQLRNEAEAAKEAMGDWEVLAMEERTMRERAAVRIQDLEEQFSAQKEAYENAVSDRDSQTQALEGLQRGLQEVQDARKRELREMVESYEEQLQALKKMVQASDARAVEAETSKEALQAETERLAPFEKEIKEKNLLIGKLRHEAIVLNDHLTKALRFLKKAKPEDNVDRQIVTNHFLHFLALDRSDPKKFQILQLIASLLGWSDEQKEQAGLARPGAANTSLRLPMSPFHRTPSTPSLSSEFFTDSPAAHKDSLADLWTNFLERSAEEGSTANQSRSGSVSSTAPRLETRGGA